MGEIFSRLYPGDVAKTVGNFAFRKLQREEYDDDDGGGNGGTGEDTPTGAEVTLIKFGIHFSAAPYLRFIKLDDSPTVVTWSDGKTETFNAAGNCCAIGNTHTYNSGKTCWVKIQNSGPWTAGYETSYTWAFLMTYNYHYNYYDEVILREMTLDHYCVGINPYGLNTCLDQEADNNYAGIRKIFIPKSVAEIGSYACISTRLRVSSLSAKLAYAVSNLEVEFESATAPSMGTGVFRTDAKGLPLRIIIPVEGFGSYAAALGQWMSLIVGKQTFKAGEQLPYYTVGSYLTCTWYRDIECTKVVKSIDTTGTYYCKLS